MCKFRDVVGGVFNECGAEVFDKVVVVVVVEEEGLFD